MKQILNSIKYNNTRIHVCLYLVLEKRVENRRTDEWGQTTSSGKYTWSVFTAYFQMVGNGNDVRRYNNVISKENVIRQNVITQRNIVAVFLSACRVI